MANESRRRLNLDVGGKDQTRRLCRLLAVFLALLVSPIIPAASSRMAGGFLGVATAAAGICPSSSQTCIYVSPSGNDHNAGTRASPFRSLRHARDVVRTLDQNMTGDITVFLENGVYRLTHPFGLGPQDSGTNGHDIVWTAGSGGRAVISGARRIRGWQLIDHSKHVWEAPIPRDLSTRQIYVNGMRASLTAGQPPVKLTTTWNGYSASSPLMAHWRNPSEIEFAYVGHLGAMSEQICPLGSITRTTIVMAQPCWYNSTRRHINFVGALGLTTPDYVMNAYELLDNPGEFYLDSTAHMLYYIPRKGQDMHTADVEAPVLQTLLSGNGTAAAPVHDIVFSNLQFSYATWLQPGSPEGFSEIQANYTITGPNGYATEGLCQFAPHGTCPYGAWTREPGSVQFSYDRNLAFINDRFLHLGAAGLNLDNGSQDATIAGSVFTDISGNGIEIGNVNMSEASGASQTSGIRVIDNHLYGLPVEYHGGVAILVGYAASSTISHNQIDHIAYTGISTGWGGWPDKIGQPPVANFSHDNVVSDNLIYDFMQVLSDGGAVYTQGVTGTSLANGERITGNVVHDQLDWSYALHSDDGAAYLTYARNVMYSDDYDWGSNHQDYAAKNGANYPQLVEDNYWQQGDESRSFARKGAIESGNTIITGPRQAPASILANAGIQPRFRFILRWKPAGEVLPNPPEEALALYAFQGKAYVTWHPSIAWGNAPVVSYTVMACLVPEIFGNGACGRPEVRPVKVSARKFKRLGYAVLSGLTDGSGYTFAVRANNRNGSSTPSVPSPAITPGNEAPTLPGAPTGIDVQPAPHAARFIWYPPQSAGCTGPYLAWVCRLPSLAFVITSSTGRSDSLTGLSQLLVASRRGRVLHIVSGLVAGYPYRFSVAAVTPAGVGPAVTFPVVRPTR